MALARNLNPKRVPKIKPKKEGQKNHLRLIVYGVIFLIIVFGVYGVFNLSRLAPKEEDRKDVAIETGDRPLPEKITIWITAPGGLNMRLEPNTTSRILKIIPNNTELVAIELNNDWYKVEYDNETGWVHKDFVRTFQEEQGTDQGSWKTHQNSAFGYSISYPEDWVVRDYGANEAANLLAYIGFGKQLANTIDPQNLPLIAIKITSDSKEIVEKTYQARTDAQKETKDISGTLATRFTFTATSGVQMNAYILSVGARTFIVEESGGYASELSRMVLSLKL